MTSAARRWAAAVAAVGVLTGVAAVPVVTATAASPPKLVALRSQQQLSISYNQGIARVPGGWILSGTNYPKPASDVLVRTDEQFNVTVANRGAIPEAWKAQRYIHIGDIDVVGNVLYAPFEEPDYTLGHQVMARYDTTTLRFMDATVVAQHQNSFVAVDPRTLIAYSMDQFDGSSLLRYDAAHGWRPLRPLTLSTLLHHTQGASVVDGAVWVSTSDDHNDVFRVSIKTGHVDLVAQVVHPLGEGEGIDVSALPSGYVHIVVVDPDQTKVWVEHFDRPVPAAGRSSTVTTLVVVLGLVVVAVGLVGVVWSATRRRHRRSAEV